jgi:YidC/Oxa1 family membrane protein insertase
MFLQIPVFLGLFHVLRRLDPAKQNKDLYGWTAEQFDSAASAKLFTAPIAGQFGSSAAELDRLGASGTTVKIIAGILVAIMIVTTYLTSRQMILKTGWAEDPQQRMIQRLMLYGIPASLLVSGAIFPIGVIIYWVTNNLFTLGQQQWVLRKYPPPVINNKSGKAVPGPGARKSSGAQQQDKPASRFSRTKANGAAQDTKPAVDGKALAPKPGAKPVNPKKRKPAKRQG